MRRFGRLVAISEQKIDGVWRVICRCDCGTTTTVRRHHLNSGHTASCGCLYRESIGQRSLRHGHSRAAAKSRTYLSWAEMVKRCSNRNDVRWPHYGGRGIKVCRRWRRFERFLADMGECPIGLTLDRIKVDGHYTPGNCRWATRATQARNQRRNKLNEAAAAAIRIAAQRGEPRRALAEQYSVSTVMVGRIVRGQSWAPQP